MTWSKRLMVVLRQLQALPGAIAAYVAHLWERGQVELQGRFSVQHMEFIRDYVRQTSWRRVLFVCFATPVLPLVILLLIDCIPLTPARLGPNANWAYWIRSRLASFCIIGGALNHLRCRMFVLPLRFRDVVWVAVVSTMVDLPCIYGVASSVGFPVPFTMVLESVFIVPVAILLLQMLLGRSLHESASLRAELFKQSNVFHGQVLMTYVYPLYFFAFTSLPPTSKSAMVFALPIIKVLIKNFFHHTLGNLNDLKPVFIVSNADLFSALYSAFCLQSSKSWTDTLLVMVVDVCQLALSFYDINRELRAIRFITDGDEPDEPLLDLFVMATSAQEVRDELDLQVPPIQSPSFLIRRPTVSVQRKSVMPRAAPTTANLIKAPTYKHAASRKRAFQPGHRVRLAKKIAKVFYIAEFVLLMEFIEVVIPLIYSIHLGAMSHLPNRAYYDQLADLEEEELRLSISQVFASFGFEITSFFFTCWFLRQQLGVSTAHLLASTLELRQEMIQSSFIMYIMYSIQMALQHSGVDFSLRFSWLKASPSAEVAN